MPEVRSVIIATSVTPLEARHIRRLAEKAGRFPAGWLHQIIRERLLLEVNKEKSLNPPGRSGSSGSTDVLPGTRQQP